MITLITGTPGSGKTLFTVSEQLTKYLKEKVTLDDGGERQRRLCVDGIKDLIIDHTMMGPTKITEKPEPEITGEGVGNWFDWCIPGDVIVIDEVQRLWRPRGMGVKPPRMIAELETHRHKGVDFVIVTQHPMLIDQNVRRLVGRHIHIRRVWGMAKTVHYEWDHCSSPEKVGDATKTFKAYPKDGYKLYKSAEVHTKQGGKIPMAFPVLVLALIAVPIVGYNAVTGGTSLVQGVDTAAKRPEGTQAKAPEKPASAPLAIPALPPASLPAPVQALLPEKPKPVGCMSARRQGKNVCSCFDEKGHPVDPDPVQCEANSIAPVDLASLPTVTEGGRPSTDPKADAEMVQWARNRVRFY